MSRRNENDSDDKMIEITTAVLIMMITITVMRDSDKTSVVLISMKVVMTINYKLYHYYSNGNGIENNY